MANPLAPMQLQLQIFEDNRHKRIRSININGEPWFFGNDICDALDIKNPSDALSKLDDDEKDDIGITDSISRKQRATIVSESGLYSLIFQSRKPEAKRFRKWVTKDVLPKIRKTGGYALSAGHNFVRRFNDNWDRVSSGYFSVISELYIRLYGRFEQIGYIIPDKAIDGTEMRPDNSVGRLFSKWLKGNFPEKSSLRKTYQHKLPECFFINAYQYPNEMLPIFIQFVEDIWIRQHAEKYLIKRAPDALQYLQKLLPNTPQ